MDLSTRLHITEKGEDEVKRRTYKLGMRRRSVLILLHTPRAIEHLLLASLFPQNEMVQEIHWLIQDGFIALSGEDNGRADKPDVPSAPAPAPTRASVLGGRFDLDDEIVLSEAKFLLTDFSVDSFGTGSQAFVDGIRACKSVNELRLSLRVIFAAAERQCPNRLPILLGLVKEINETA